MVGALGALYVKAGFGPDFWATIAPHGVIELTSIQIAGGAGLLLAAGYLRPGRARRGDALVAAARRAVTLVLGVAMLLCVAGTIEGFVSPLRLSIPIRGAIGAATGVALFAYLFGAGLQQPARLDVDVRVEEREGQLGRRNIDDEDAAPA
jgi:hypothetical protein